MKRAALAALALVLAMIAVWWLRGGSRAVDRRAGEAPAAARPGDSVTPPATHSGPPPRAPLAPPADRRALVRGAWGSGDGQFGRRHDPESRPEVPMAIAAGARGEFSIVDQVNRRVLRYKDGKLVSSFPIGGDTPQDLALVPGGKTALLDRLADKNVQLYDSSGKLENEIALAGAGVPEAGGVTGVFADGDGVYVERGHGALVRIASAGGRSDPDRGELAGRPTRDGKLLVSAAITDRAAGRLVVRAIDRATGQPAWSAEVALPAPILYLLLLDSDLAGRVYVGAETGAESAAPPYLPAAPAIWVQRIEGGAPRGLLELPAPSIPDETFRPLTVDDDGTIYQMLPSDTGLEVLRWSF